jgi:non-ribosomal peptide synthetase component F
MPEVPLSAVTSPPDFRLHAAELKLRANTWTQSAVFARLSPDGVAVRASQGQRSFAQLHGHANQLSHALRAAGLRAGDALALLCRNRAEFIESIRRAYAVVNEVRGRAQAESFGALIEANLPPA